jgi:B-cell receptor-associated protein 31
MSLQWTLVATVLYAEILICILLLLPFISATRWRSLFKSRIFNAFTSYANLYFTVFVVILIILFFDGVRDVRRYSTPLDAHELNINPAAETVLHMKLFRAQRNFYIAGFALFLFLVLRRLVTLVSRQATLMADYEAAQRQATSATSAAKRFLEDQENKTNEVGETKKAKELEVTKEEINKLKTELSRTVSDRDTMKQQAEAISKEYDRLMTEHTALQETLKKREGVTSESKKDE